MLEQFGGPNGELEAAAERSDPMKLLNGKHETGQMAHEATNPVFLTPSGGGRR